MFQSRLHFQGAITNVINLLKPQTYIMYHQL